MCIKYFLYLPPMSLFLFIQKCGFWAPTYLPFCPMSPFLLFFFLKSSLTNIFRGIFCSVSLIVVCGHITNLMPFSYLCLFKKPQNCTRLGQMLQNNLLKACIIKFWSLFEIWTVEQQQYNVYFELGYWKFMGPSLSIMWKCSLGADFVGNNPRSLELG